ncbi:MAG: FMN-binding negative transcriptional regulator [Pseudomonadota bacterium]
MNTSAANQGKTSPFEDHDSGDVQLLIEQYPLAWVCTKGGAEASQLPLIGVFNEAGRLYELIGHCARRNPLVSALTHDPSALILFSGPSGYISPRMTNRRDWGPTWNYANIRISAEITIDPDLTAEAIHMLARKMEHGHDKAWSVYELKERYNQLFPLIVGFRARVKDLQARFKLCQDEQTSDYQPIIANLENGDLRDWMLRFNRWRHSA